MYTLARMANRIPQHITRTGVIPVYNAAASGDSVTPGGQVFLHVKNGSGGSVNATIATTENIGGLPVGDLVVACAIGETMIGPIIPDLFADPTDGFAHITWSATATVTWAAITL